MDFGGGPLESAGNRDIFVAKLDPAGNHLWSKRFGDADQQYIGTIAADLAGNVLLTGNFNTSVDFGGGPLLDAGGGDIFVAKLDPAGNHLWSKRFGDADQQYGDAVAVDSAGNVLLTGFFHGSMDFGGGPLTNTADADIFVAKLDPAGNHLWSKRFGGADTQYGMSITADLAGDVLLTGNFNGSVDFGGGPLSGAGNYDIFIAKLDPAGNHLWSKRFGDADFQSASAAAVDSAGNVLLTGDFLGTVDLGGGPFKSEGDGVFVAKLYPAGNHLWSKPFRGGNGVQHVTGTAVDGEGNVVIIDSLQGAGAVDLGCGPLPSTGGADIFVVRFDPAGNQLSSQRFGQAGSKLSATTSVDLAGHVVIAGSFDGALDFGKGSLDSAGAQDIFVAKLSP